ncbi:hypothetical protein [Oscillibacter sp.]|uniref:hypothetical protein n=1 Tax=Oscillibacter sp. TaxID=1945593 RepID=UPI0028AB24E0|nr:hypothetical protein [Oscillibacter sp.]
MKTQLKHIIALVCTFVLCAGLTVPTGAINMDHVITHQASDQLAYYAAYALTSSGGNGYLIGLLVLPLRCLECFKNPNKKVPII